MWFPDEWEPHSGARLHLPRKALNVPKYIIIKISLVNNKLEILVRVLIPARTFSVRTFMVRIKL